MTIKTRVRTHDMSTDVALSQSGSCPDAANPLQTDADSTNRKTIICPKCCFEIPLPRNDGHLTTKSKDTKKVKIQPPWWSHEVEQAICDKRRALRVRRQSKKRYDFWTYRQAKNYARHVVKSAKAKYLETLESSKESVSLEQSSSNEIQNQSFVRALVDCGNISNSLADKEAVLSVLNSVLCLVEKVHAEAESLNAAGD